MHEFLFQSHGDDSLEYTQAHFLETQLEVLNGDSVKLLFWQSGGAGSRRRKRGFIDYGLLTASLKMLRTQTWLEAGQSAATCSRMSGCGRAHTLTRAHSQYSLDKQFLIPSRGQRLKSGFKCGTFGSVHM